MRIKNQISLILIVLCLPFLLANKSCIKATTWGKTPVYAKWDADHPDIDEETRCIDCHDDISSPKFKPANHDAFWLRKHGSYSWKKFGYRKGNVCRLCHTESMCAKCHQQQAPANHTEFWKMRGHGAFVGLNRSSCMTCHKSPDFCERCHSSTKPVTHNALWAGTTNAHCQNCHLPVTSPEAQKCFVCHKSTPAHPF